MSQRDHINYICAVNKISSHKHNVSQSMWSLNISLQIEGMTNLQVNILLMNTLPFTDIINYDWNIVGLDVSEKRNFFQEQYEVINESIHELAEGIMHLDLLIQ